MNHLSKLVIYSIAIVAANKELNSNKIECVPIEHMPMLDGELTDNAALYSASGVDASGAKYNTSLNTTVSVSATWLPVGSDNRVTSPDVRRGEMVILYRFADTDDFRWVTMATDMKLRKLETVIYAFSGTPNESDIAGADSSYYLEISTHNGMVHFHTSNANGEPYKYDIQINTKTGFIQIQDDDGNYFKFDSVEEQMSMVNKSGSVVEINKKAINFASLESINLQTVNYNLTCTNEKIITDTLDRTVNVSSIIKSGTLDQTTDTDTTIKSGTIKQTTTSLDVTSGTSKFTADTHDSATIITQKGDVTITGILTENGMFMLNGGLAMGAGAGGAPSAASIVGDMHVTGAMKQTGDVDIQGLLTNNGVNVGSTHTHTIAGVGTTGSPN